MASMGFLKRLLGGTTPERADQTWRKTTQGARILVVDDSATIRAVLGRMLEVDGYEVVRAADGESALEMARAEPPAMIFLDIVLPGMNGFAVLRALRHDPLTQHVPIVMISGNQQATEQFYVQRFGADDFISKPFGQAEVARSIDRLVGFGRLSAREAAKVVSLPVSVPVETIPAMLANASEEPPAVSVPELAA
ncbi:twitching motility two-component system response regulator PilH [Dyella jiangningensis]|uniref:response regulator n=1 Tax=Dyella sp. AtDHG13 TaxID=1938897 RepID=UPI000890E322|nr:response regulator [Dyella sp. AtDHG13]PXV58562.1 twitching motility two-component system response regulator PilH [Dyella sp. AtDHG13]SDL15367.1 twitching motility two-component system response regulator PilH [Dyella jiangningensis]